MPARSSRIGQSGRSSPWQQASSVASVLCIGQFLLLRPVSTLALLPREVGGRRLRHALDVRHPSFATPAFLALARRYGCAPVCTDSDQFPAIADAEADFAYLRLMRSQRDVATGYTPAAIAQWAEGVRTWTTGERPRDVFVYFINGAKERAPAGAMALLQQLGMGVRR